MGQETTLPAKPCLTEHHCIHSALLPAQSGFTPHSILDKEHVVNGNHGMTQLSQISQGGHSRHERTMPGYLGKEQSSPRTLFAQHTLLCLYTYSKSSAGLIEIVLNTGSTWALVGKGGSPEFT